MELVEMLIWIICIMSFQAMFLVVVFWIGVKGGLLKYCWTWIRGGSLIAKFDGNNSFELLREKKAVSAIQLKVINEQGKEVEAPVRITGIKHYLKGTSLPVHVVVAGHNENINLLKIVKPTKDARYVNQWGQELLQTGVQLGSLTRDDSMKPLFERLAPLFTIILICGILACVAMNYIILTNMAPPGTG